MATTIPVSQLNRRSTLSKRRSKPSKRRSKPRVFGRYVQSLVHLIEGTFDVGNTSFKRMRVHGYSFQTIQRASITPWNKMSREVSLQLLCIVAVDCQTYVAIGAYQICRVAGEAGDRTASLQGNSWTRIP